MPKQVVFIAPYGPPGTNGVCDHVSSLVSELSSDADLAIRRIGVSTGNVPIDPTHASIVEKSDSAGLLRALDRTVEQGAHVFLHYVNYAYDRNGCPFGLLNSLKALRAKRNFQLVTMFHELAASGPPWKSACYTGPLQSYVWRKQACLSDIVATSTAAYKKRIQRVCANVETHPIFSNIGEPHNPPALTERANRAVLFGQSGSRKHVIRSSHLASVIRKLEVSEVIEIGRPHGEPTPALPNVNWIRSGELSAADVSEALINSRFGLLYYAPKLLPKSGVFGAYCSHRVAPVLFPAEPERCEGIESGEHYFNAEESAGVTAESAQRIADYAWNWYCQSWSVRQCAALYSKWLNDAAQRSASAGFVSNRSALVQPQ